MLGSRLVSCVWIAAAALVGATSSRAQVRTDGSLGPKQTLNGPNFGIGANLGRQAGGNLYHSFAQFDVGANQAATFSGPGSVRNVLARVTGAPSRIDGQIRCDIPKANLFLVNPSGVVFGPGASLDVRGSFVVTTADYVRMGKGGERFSGTPVKGEVLSTASPAAFGFLDARRSVVGLAGANLAVRDGRAISIVSRGRVELFASQVAATGGRVNVAATAGPGEVALDADRLDTPVESNVAKFGNINFLQDSQILTSGNGGGKVFVLGKNATLDTGLIRSDTIGPNDGRGIDVRLTGTLHLLNGSTLRSDTVGPGAGGTIDVMARAVVATGSGDPNSANLAANAILQTTSNGRIIVRATDSVTLRNGGVFQVGTLATGDAGSITVETGTLSLRGKNSVIAGAIASVGRGAGILLKADRMSVTRHANVVVATAGAGSPGSIDVDVGDLTLAGGGTINASAVSGPAGNVDVRALRTVTLRDGGQIVTAALGGFDAGNVSVTADVIRMENASTILSGSSPGSTGNSGRVTVRARTLDVGPTSFVLATTFGSGRGGLVTVEADEVTIRGNGSEASSGLFAGSAPGTTGTSGAIDLRARTVSVARGGTIAVQTGGSGAGGDVSVAARSITLQDPLTAIKADTVDPAVGGPGGTVRVDADQLSIMDGASVVGGTFGSGAGGNVVIDAREVTVRGTDSNIFAGSGAAMGGGPGGTLTLRAGDVLMTGGGAIFVGTLGSGAGGRLDMAADSLRVIRGGAVIAATTGSGSSGSATIVADRIFMRGFDADVPFESETVIAAGSLGGSGGGGRLSVRAGSIRLENGAAIAAGTNGPGAGGDAVIVADRIRLDRSGLIVPSVDDNPDVEATGNAGSIDLTARRHLELRNGSALTARADLADAGNIVVRAPRVMLRDSQISAQAVEGAGGSINVTAKTLLYLFSSQINAEGKRAIGNITIDPIFTVLNKSSIVTDTSAPNGGDIDITTDRLFRTPDSVINAKQGTATVTELTPDLDVSGSLVPVNISLFDRSVGFAEVCPVRIQSDQSSFLITSSGALPIQPGGLYPSIDLRGPATRPVGR